MFAHPRQKAGYAPALRHETKQTKLITPVKFVQRTKAWNTLHTINEM